MKHFMMEPSWTCVTFLFSHIVTNVVDRGKYVTHIWVFYPCMWWASHVHVVYLDWPSHHPIGWMMWHLAKSFGVLDQIWIVDGRNTYLNIYFPSKDPLCSAWGLDPNVTPKRVPQNYILTIDFGKVCMIIYEPLVFRGLKNCYFYTLRPWYCDKPPIL
jgi:hypothetical protein